MTPPDITEQILDALLIITENPANVAALEDITPQIRRARPDLTAEEAQANARALFMLDRL
ncbi:hypothetical protein D3875_03585 [Deinococcus cavernae]|uniref:Uncharacterized protein n=1 Tax=Deinococcus cavernae TaxID=2320857 RepID=A0A418VEX4_9DEIO|nr:hypothetical protein [Deinococcus cavernae]RJF74636.1 hypothetical protein D3875_03585 [Deinococcus cavernae]